MRSRLLSGATGHGRPWPDLGLAGVQPPNLPSRNLDHSKSIIVDAQLRVSQAQDYRLCLFLGCRTISTSKGYKMFTRLGPRSRFWKKRTIPPLPSCQLDQPSKSMLNLERSSIRLFLAGCHCHVSEPWSPTWSTRISRPRTTLNGAQKQLARHAPDVSDLNC